MKNIVKDIEKNELKRVYLIYGEEKYLVRSMKERFIKGVVKEGDTLNFSRFAGKDCNAKQVIDLAETMPFLAEYRVLLLEDTNWFKTANEDMASYVESIPENTVLIFVESEVDKRNKLYKQVKAHGYICECNRMNHADLTKWILVRFKKENKNITKENMNYLLEKLGEDMDNINSELEKLISYTWGREVIEKEDIDNVCISEITGKIFEMVDAMGNKNQKKALELYYDLIAVREAPMRILFMLTRQFHIMYQIKELSQKGAANSEIAAKAGLAPFIVNKTMKQCRNFTQGALRKALNDCLKMEEAVKQGNMNDKMAVEMILVKYSAH